MTQKEIKEKIQSQIDHSTILELEIVYIPLIMRNQTQNELKMNKAIEKNGTCLNLYDTQTIGSIIRSIKPGRHMSDKQALLCRKIIRKYWKQFYDLKQTIEMSGIKSQKELNEF